MKKLQQEIKRAQIDNTAYKREVINSFGTTVRMVKENAYSASAYNSLSEAMIIFKKGTNEKATDWIYNIMNILGIAGGMISYSGFDDGSQNLGYGSIIGIAAVYLIGQKVIVYKKNNDSEIQKSLEALSRNIVYGNLIREDSINLVKLKQTADSLTKKIKYVNQYDPGEVKNDWIPSQVVIDLSYVLLGEMENSMIFWNNISSTSQEMLDKSASFLTSEGRAKLNDNIVKAQSLLSIRIENIKRFRAKIYYLEKQYSEETNK